jgi:hypothetical protein
LHRTRRLFLGKRFFVIVAGKNLGLAAFVEESVSCLLGILLSSQQGIEKLKE